MFTSRLSYLKKKYVGGGCVFVKNKNDIDMRGIDIDMRAWDREGRGVSF